MSSPINNTKEFCKHEKVINHCPFPCTFQHFATTRTTSRNAILFRLSLRTNERPNEGEGVTKVLVMLYASHSNFQFAQCADENEANKQTNKKNVRCESNKHKMCRKDLLFGTLLEFILLSFSPFLCSCQLATASRRRCCVSSSFFSFLFASSAPSARRCHSWKC